MLVQTVCPTASVHSKHVRGKLYEQTPSSLSCNCANCASVVLAVIDMQLYFKNGYPTPVRGVQKLNAFVAKTVFELDEDRLHSLAVDLRQIL